MRAAIAGLAAGLAAAGAVPAMAQVPAARPRLVVMIAVDQLRADYMDRFRPFFGRGGFNLFLQRGASFAEARYEHTTTSTCVGHAIMLTGSSPSENGIISNDWFDARSGHEVYCAADTTVALIGRSAEGRSPRNLAAATVGDVLKIATGGKSRVITMSHKDRSAIMLGGHLGDAAYWMEDTLFVTSTYYRRDLPSWVREINAAGKVTSYLGKKWERLLPPSAYEMVGPDDVPTESDEAGMGRTFPHVIRDSTLGEEFVEAYELTPFGNDLLADFAMRAVTEEGLGRDSIPDLLGISFSANDRVGHAYGPDSHEVMDVTIRLDRTLARLFGFLDRTVGLANTVIALTADHGVAPLPEVFARLHPGADARRFHPAVIDSVVNDSLDARYGPAPKPGWVLYHEEPMIYLNLEAIRIRKLKLEEVEETARVAVSSVRGVHDAMTATELARNRSAGDRSPAVLSFYPERSGNVYYQMKPYILVDDEPTGTGHGTQWAYDQQVPLLWFGSRIIPGIRQTPATVADIAPTLSAILGLTAPVGAKGRALAEILR